MKTNPIRDAFAKGELSRRDLHKLLAAAGLGLATLPFGGGRARAAAGDLQYFTWSGYDLPGFHPGYVETHGGSPSISIFADEEEALQKLRAGFQCDVVHPCSGRTHRWREAGVIQSIDTGRLSNWADVIEPLKGINGANDDGQQWFVPVDWGNTSLLYRTDLVELEGEPSWSLLWDERYAGRLAIGDNITDTATIVALMAGAADPYNMTEEELGKVRELLRRQKPLLRFYWSDVTALEQALASGEIVASSSWNSSYVALASQGLPVSFAAPKEGALAWVCGLVLSSNAQNVDLAYDLIDAMISPEAGRWLMTEYGYGHSNVKSFDLVGDEGLAQLGLPRDPQEVFKKAVFSRDNARLDELQALFEEVKAGL